MGARMFALASALALGETQSTATAPLRDSLAYQTVILSAASYLARFSLLRVYLASRLGVLSLMTPVFEIGFGIAVLSDDLTTEFVEGTALILLGIVFVSVRDLLVQRMDRSPVAALSR